MKERPILFTGSNVRAILEGRKPQTRRVMKPQPSAGVRQSPFVRSGIEDGHGRELRCPYGQPGDRLWVREAVWLPPPVTQHDLREGADTWPKCIYSADTDDTEIAWMRDMQWKQRPSIHMPRWASRILLEITDVRVQRVQDISEEDAIAEGIRELPLQERSSGAWWCADPLGNPTLHYRTPRAAFATLWDSINERRGFGWAVNPFVWAITFIRVEASHG